MALGQKTLKVRDTGVEVKEGVTDIMYVSESVFANLEKKDPKRYRVIKEVKEDYGDQKPRGAQA